MSDKYEQHNKNTTVLEWMKKGASHHSQRCSLFRQKNVIVCLFLGFICGTACFGKLISAGSRTSGT